LRIARDDPRNGRVGRFRYAERDDMRVVCAKQLHNFQHRPHLVRQKNRKLLYQRPFQLGTRLRQISSHLNDGGDGNSPGRASPNYLIVGVSLANLICWWGALKLPPQRPLHDLTWRSTCRALHSLSEYGRRKRADRAQAKKT